MASSSSASTTDLSGHVVVVTGATRGIGRGLAIGLGERGAHVVATGRTAEGQDSLASVRDAVVSAGGSCDVYLVDHSDSSSTRQFFSSLSSDLDRSGRKLSTFVNNAYAGVKTIERNASTGAKFWELECASGDDPAVLWDSINNVGLRNNYICSVYATRLFLSSGNPGTVVNISSFGAVASLFNPAYCIGKAGVDRMTAEFAAQGPDSVRFMTFYPGVVDTEEIGRLARKAQSIGSKGESQTIPYWNLETPLFVGRSLAALLADEKLTKETSGRVIIAAEVADRKGIYDERGFRPLSLRSPRFTVLSTLPGLAESRLRFFIPRWPLFPWWAITAAVGPVKYW